MKKIVLGAAFLLVAFTGNSSLKGSILVNTVSFADLPEKPVTQTNKVKLASTAKVKSAATECTGQVKTPERLTPSCAPVNSCAVPVSR